MRLSQVIRLASEAFTVATQTNKGSHYKGRTAIQAVRHLHRQKLVGLRPQRLHGAFLFNMPDALRNRKEPDSGILKHQILDAASMLVCADEKVRPCFVKILLSDYLITFSCSDSYPEQCRFTPYHI